MKKEIKELLIEALKSGQYKKCTGNLAIGEARCVLGVVCELYTKHTGNNWRGLKVPGDRLIPLEVAEWSGIDSFMEDRLFRMNDARGCTFITIASKIEEQE